MTTGCSAFTAVRSFTTKDFVHLRNPWPSPHLRPSAQICGPSSPICVHLRASSHLRPSAGPHWRPSGEVWSWRPAVPRRRARPPTSTDHSWTQCQCTYGPTGHPLNNTRHTHQPPGLKIVCLLAALPEPIIAAGGVARRRWFNISTTACAGSLARPSPNRHRQREFFLRTRNSGGSQSNGPARTWSPRFSTRLRTNKRRTGGFPVRA